MDAHISQETPQARVEWHLACIEARRNGTPPPKAPWESVEEKKEPTPRKPREGRTRVAPLAELKLPERPDAVTSQSKRGRSLGNGKEKEQWPQQKDLPVSRDKPVAPRVTPRDIPRSSVTIPPRHATTPRLQPVSDTVGAADPKPQQVSAVPDIARRRDKELVIDALLLEAGVPMALLLTEGRTRAVFCQYLQFRQVTASPAKLGAQYDIGKQFQLSGSVSEALRVADAIIRVVEAPSPDALATAQREAQSLLIGLIRPKNIAFLQHRV